MNRIPPVLLRDYLRGQTPGDEEDDDAAEESSPPPTLAPDAGVFARIHYAIWSPIYPWIPSRKLARSLRNIALFIGAVVLISELHRVLVMFDLAQGLPPADLAKYPHLSRPPPPIEAELFSSKKDEERLQDEQTIPSKPWQDRRMVAQYDEDIKDDDESVDGALGLQEEEPEEEEEDE